MRRVAVTGGTGFVAANLTRRLLDEGDDVHILVRPGSPSWRLDGVRDRVTVHEADLGNAAQVRTAISAIEPEWVFHLAAHGGHSSQTNVTQIVTTNVVGTVNVLEACLETGFEAFVQTGSSSEYGLKEFPPSEEEWLDPDSNYAVTKASATLYCRHTARTQDAHVVTLRLYSVYGPFEDPSRLIPTLVAHAMRGELPPLVDPKIARDFVHVEDVLDACIEAARRTDLERGTVLNVGTGVQTSLSDLVDLARELFDLRAEPAWGTMEPRSWDTTTWVADSSRIRAVLGWLPRVTLPEGLTAMRRWLADQRPFHERYDVRA